MKKNQETAHTILLEILNGTRPLTEDGIRALVQEDPEIAILLILEQARRLRDILGSKQRKAENTPSGMIPPHKKPNTQKDKKRRCSGATTQVTKGLAAKIWMRLRKQWSSKSALLLSCGKCAKAIKVKRGHGCNLSVITIFPTLKRRGLNPVPIIVEALKTLITTGELPPFPPAVSPVG